MANGVGDTILRAAQSVVAQFQNQTRLQQQQVQFEAQLKQAERTFNLRSQELQARERSLKLQEEDFAIRSKTAPFQLAITKAQAELQTAAASPEMIDQRRRKNEAEIRKLIAESGAGGGGLTPNKAFEARKELVDGAQELRERSFSEQYVNGLEENQQKLVAPYKALTVDELRKEAQNLERALLDPVASVGPGAAQLTQKRDIVLDMLDQTRGATLEPMSEEDLVQFAAAARGIPPTDAAGLTATRMLLNLEGSPTPLINSAFGSDIANTTAGRHALDTALRARDVKWFVDALRPRVSGQNSEAVLRSFAEHLGNTLPRSEAVRIFQATSQELGLAPGQ
jgi:hypothetical protein